MVARFRGALEVVIRNIKIVAHVNEMLRHFIGKLLGRDAQFARFLGHFQAVFVRSGLEPHIAAHGLVEPGDDICRNGFIGMADMRLAIGIADGGGDIIRRAHGGLSSCWSFNQPLP